MENWDATWKYNGAEHASWDKNGPQTVHTGMEIDNGIPEFVYSEEAQKICYSRHFTYLFNIFVFL